MELTSDEELVLTLIETYGDECVQHIYGDDFLEDALEHLRDEDIVAVYEDEDGGSHSNYIISLDALRVYEARDAK